MSLRIISAEELKGIVRLHLDWLTGVDGGVRANLSSANLSSANLSSANLRSANLSSANLSSADLSSADLRFANLRSADLRYANLSSANLRYADLRSANLRSANLRYADLRSACVGGANDGLRPESLGLPPADDTFLRSVCEAALGDGALDMAAWHSCATTHCLAGWAVTLAGPAGRALEAVTSPSVAGSLLIPDAAHMFYATDEEAREFCRSVLAAEATA